MRLISILFFILLLTSCEKEEIANFEGEFDVSVMSFNLRYDEPADEENQWENRKDAIITMLGETQPLILSIQEGLRNQVNFLDDNLTSYDYVGVGRDDGHSSGEYSAIFYSIDHFELLETGNFWLSETPETPSLGWDANNIRIVTWAKLNDIENNKTIYVFNTHFDHKGKTAQEESSKLIVQKIEEIAEDHAPIFITGDFNLLIGNSRLEPITEVYSNAQKSADRGDDYNSFNGFGKLFRNRNIDFIFYDNADALSYKTVIKDYDVPYISDHYPIIAHFNYQ